jgi:hypothetical protein
LGVAHHVPFLQRPEADAEGRGELRLSERRVLAHGTNIVGIDRYVGHTAYEMTARDMGPNFFKAFD